MKTIFKILFVITLLLFSCNKSSKLLKNIESTVDIDPKLTKFTSDSLIIKRFNSLNNPEGKSKYDLLFFDDKEGFCRLRNDTILISNDVGFMTGKSIVILIYKGKFNINLHNYSCEYSEFSNPIEQTLTLNKSSYNVNDTIIGELFFKGSFVIDHIVQNIVETTTIKGKFKFRVRDSSYNYRTFLQEYRYNHFLKIAQNRPDTIRKLTISDYGFNKLPSELSRFSNLEELDFEVNSLNNVDLSLLATLPKLKVIDFSNCDLTQFPTVVFSLKQLTELNLFGNKINKLPLQLFQMTKLKKLKIGANDYTFLPAQIGNLKNLEVLSIERTPVKKLPSSITQLKKLKKFYPPDSLDYLPMELAKCLPPNESSYYSGIKNYDLFKNLIVNQ